MQRLAAPQEVVETCRRVREALGPCRVIIVAGAATAPLLRSLGCADEVVRMSRWTAARVRALLRRLRRRGVTDTCLVYDSAAQPGPARLELLALLLGAPLYWRQPVGGLARLSRSRLWLRLLGEMILALLAAASGAIAGLIVALALAAVQPLLARPRARDNRQRQRLRLWKQWWLRRL